MSGLAEVFPAIAFLSGTVIAIYILLIGKKLSRGSQSAGPVLTPTQRIHGLSARPWDEAAISASLQRDPQRTVAIVSELCRSVGIEPGPAASGPRLAVEQMVGQLELYLERDKTPAPDERVSDE